MRGIRRGGAPSPPCLRGAAQSQRVSLRLCCSPTPQEVSAPVSSLSASPPGRTASPRGQSSVIPGQRGSDPARPGACPGPRPRAKRPQARRTTPAARWAQPSVQAALLDSGLVPLVTGHEGDPPGWEHWENSSETGSEHVSSSSLPFQRRHRPFPRLRWGPRAFTPPSPGAPSQAPHPNQHPPSPGTCHRPTCHRPCTPTSTRRPHPPVTGPAPQPALAVLSRSPGTLCPAVP